MIRKAYRATRVNDVDWDKLARGNEGVDIVLGVDVSKRDLWPVCRWSNGRFERPWRVKSPEEIPTLIDLVQEMTTGRKLVVAMESSGTYGDAFRQALTDAKISVVRVSNKAAKDYAEIFDGVPSQHDGKDAAVIAELAALNKVRPWDYQAPSEWEQELRYWVNAMVVHRKFLTSWLGRLEGVVARHWPEATRVLKLTSVTLLRALAHYGDPTSLAADGEAVSQLRRWGRAFLAPGKAERVVAEARSSVGVRVGHWQRQEIQEYARQALIERRLAQKAQRRLCELAVGNEVLQAQGKVVGIPTACVLWTSTGDPRNYQSAAAYRKAIGLNLKERSSGEYQGEIRISKRGSALARQWLYFAALRWIQKGGVRPWYEAMKARKEDDARRVLVALMRKLDMALYHVGVKGEEFQPRRLFGRTRRGGVRGKSKP
jgi:transposase